MTTIKVTAEDIARGERRCSRVCPIALAMQREGFLDADVTPDMDDYWDASWLDADGDPEGCSLPPSAGAFANAYDDGAPVKPFSFMVDA